MKLSHSLCIFALSTSSVFCKKATDPHRVPRNAILLSKVSTLTLHDGKLTAARRSSPVPQLKCVGPADVCKLYTVDVMRCTNEGSGYHDEDIQWACRAQLPEEFKIGGTDVGCEGYESSEDPYILSGSCGVEYRLLLTETGEAKYGAGRKAQNNRYTQQSYDERSQSYRAKHEMGHEESNIPGVLFMILFLAVAGVIVYSLVRACLSDNRQPGGTTTDGWGGGGGPDDPPPPYDYPSPPKKQSTPRASTYSPRSSTRTRSANSAAGRSQGWGGPGFWTGAAAGAAGGYLAGRRRQGTQTRMEQPEVQQRGGGSWLFGGGNRGSGSSNVGSSSSSSASPAYSSSRYESTGFGSSSRR